MCMRAIRVPARPPRVQAVQKCAPAAFALTAGGACPAVRSPQLEKEYDKLNTHAKQLTSTVQTVFKFQRVFGPL